MHRYFAVSLVPVAEKFPTEADAYAGAEPAVFVPSNEIPLETNQSIVTIDTTEANARNSIGIGGVRITLHHILV